MELDIALANSQREFLPTQNLAVLPPLACKGNISLKKIMMNYFNYLQTNIFHLYFIGVAHRLWCIVANRKSSYLKF